MKQTHYRLLGLVLPLVHVIVCVVALVAPSEGSWRWFPVFVADFPFSVLIVQAANAVEPFTAFVTLGTLWWYALNRLMLFALRKGLSWSVEPVS